MFFGTSAEQPNAKAQATTTAIPKQQGVAGNDSLSPETANSGGLSRSSSLSDRLRSSWKGGVSSLLKKSQDNVRADALAKARRSREGRVTAGAETGKAQADIGTKSKGKEPVELPAPDSLRKHTTDSERTTKSSVVDPGYSPNSQRFRTAENPPPAASKSPLPQESSVFDDSSSDEDDQSPVIQRASSVRVGKPTLVRHTSNAAAIHVVRHEHSPTLPSGLSQRSTATVSKAHTSGAVSQSAIVQGTEAEPASQSSSSREHGPEDALSRLEGTNNHTNQSSPQRTTKPLPVTPATSIPVAQYSPSRPLVASPSTYSTTFSAPHPTSSSITPSTNNTKSDNRTPTTSHLSTSPHQHQPISIPFPTPLSPLSALHSNPVSPSTASAAAALNNPISRLSRALSAPTHPGTPPNRNPNRRVTIRPSDLVIVHSEHDHRLFRDSVVTTPYPEKGASSDQEGLDGDSRNRAASGRLQHEGSVGRSRSVGGGTVGFRSGRRNVRGSRLLRDEDTEAGSSPRRKGTVTPNSKHTVTSSSNKNRLSDIPDDDASRRSSGEHEHAHVDREAGSSDKRSPSLSVSASASVSDDKQLQHHNNTNNNATSSSTPRNHSQRHQQQQRHYHDHDHHDHHVQLPSPSPFTPTSPHGPGDRNHFPSLSSSESLFLVLSIVGHPERSATVEIEVPPTTSLAGDFAAPGRVSGPSSSAASSAAAGSHAAAAGRAASHETTATGKGLFATLRTQHRNRLSKHPHAHQQPIPDSPSTPPPLDDTHLFTLLQHTHKHALQPSSPPLLRLLFAPTRTLASATLAPFSPDTPTPLDSASFIAHLKNPSLGRGRRGWLLWFWGAGQQERQTQRQQEDQQQQQQVVARKTGSRGSGIEGMGMASGVSASAASAAASGGGGRAAPIYPPRMPFQRSEERRGGGGPPRVVLGYRFNYGVIASAVLGWLVVGAVVVVVWVLVGMPGGRVGAGGAGELRDVGGGGGGGVLGELRTTQLLGGGGNGTVHGSGKGDGSGNWRVDSQMRVLTGLVLGGGVTAAGLVVTGLWVLGGWILL